MPGEQRLILVSFNSARQDESTDVCFWPFRSISRIRKLFPSTQFSSFILSSNLKAAQLTNLKNLKILHSVDDSNKLDYFSFLILQFYSIFLDQSVNETEVF
jgi:hypothetical protein